MRVWCCIASVLAFGTSFTDHAAYRSDIVCSMDEQACGGVDESSMKFGKCVAVQKPAF
jgi:hypothetical protein